MARRGSFRPALRLIALLAACALLLSAVVIRLVQLQVVRAEPLELLGSRQRIRAVELPAKRGAIFDRDLIPLAVSTEARAVYADPRFVDDPGAAGEILAPALGLEEGFVEERLTREGAFVYLARRVPPAVAARVTSLGFPFIGTLKETRRSYPAGALAGQVLGFVGTDNVGLSGLESRFDALLRGAPGRQVIEQDPNGRPIPQGRNSVVQPVPGQGLALTIDRDIQFALEQALERGARKTKARSGMALVLDPRTGEIVAMANWPPLDPNRFGETTDEQRRNRLVTDAYEPGSVNKVITAAASIEAGLASPGMELWVPYRLRVSNKTFSDFAPHPTERLTYAEALARSSNIGTIKIALRLGKKRLYDALEAFGLGRPTGIAFPGESPGILLRLNDWYSTSIGTIPIGHGIAVTPLQMAMVYAAIANDGVQVQPNLIRGRVAPDGTLAPAPPPARRRVVSPFTASQVRGMLIGAVEQGTGRRAQIPGYLVAGKTGTARVPLRGKRGYSGDIITTFVGMAPADDPRLVVLTSLDNPRPRFSALTAAPVFREIMSFALAALGIPPTIGVPDGVPLVAKRAPAPARPASPTIPSLRAVPAARSSRERTSAP